MFAVIFKAKPGSQNQAYSEMVAKLRKLAFEKYHCVDFISATADDMEVAISYWQTEQDIVNWKQDPLHQQAQQQGRETWYLNYQVEVMALTRSYHYSQNQSL